MEIRVLIKKILEEQVNQQLQLLKDKYVGEGKLFSEEEFKNVEDVAGNKWYLTAWLTRRVASNIIKKEDIYKWKEYFEIFEKNKNKFEHKDINLYKTADDIKKLLDNIIEVREGNIKFEPIQNNEYFVSPKDIEKLEQGGGIKYYGIWKPDKNSVKLAEDGYQVFEVSEPTKENWKLYRDILGRCKGREKGAKIDICTIASYEFFKQYLKNPKGSSYFVLFNLNDFWSPYQLHVESNQFYNKSDADRYNFPVLPFYLWLGEKNPKYKLDYLLKFVNLEIPSPGKGYEDENGKQGIWLTYEDGEKLRVVTYVDNQLTGPFIEYWAQPKGKKKYVGRYYKGKIVGEYEEYNQDGSLSEKGKFSSKSDRKGLWVLSTHFQYAPDVTKMIYDYDKKLPTSGLTKNDVLRLVCDSAFDPKWTGKFLSFYLDGSTKSMGNLTQAKGQRTGWWIYYFKDGSIRAQGRYANDSPTGEWTFIFKKKNKKYIFTFDYSDKNQKGKLYDAKGNFLDKVKIGSDRLPTLLKLTEI